MQNYNSKIKKLLYVVPNIELVTQTEEKFLKYEEISGRTPKCSKKGSENQRLEKRQRWRSTN
jgi:superfamily II DNA or RNA helicase